MQDVPEEVLALLFRPIANFGDLEYQLSILDTMQFVRTILSRPATAAPAEGGGSGPRRHADFASSLFEVIDSDDRINVNEEAKSDSRVGALWDRCTCFKLANHDTCVTNAHCLFQNGRWKPRADIQFAAGAANVHLSNPTFCTNYPEACKPLPVLPPDCYSLAVPGAWASDEHGYFDFGVIALHGRGGAWCNPDDYNVGYFGYSVLEWSSYGSAFILGYPSPVPKGWPYPTLTLSDGGYQMPGDLGAVMVHNIDATDGQSGAPLFQKNRLDQVIGIHYGGNSWTNAAVPMRQALIDFVNAFGGHL